MQFQGAGDICSLTPCQLAKGFIGTFYFWIETCVMNSNSPKNSNNNNNNKNSTKFSGIRGYYYFCSTRFWYEGNS